MDSSSVHLLFLLLTVLVFSMAFSSSADVQSQGRVDSRRPLTARRHRVRARKTPEEAIRRQIERVKEKILSQLGVRTIPRPGSVRPALPQPLLYMYDVDMSRQGAVGSTFMDIQHRRGVQARRETDEEYKRASLIVFGRQSKCTSRVLTFASLPTTYG